jgi:hypothetical protein
MADTAPGGIPNPTPPVPVISYVVSALRRRVESTPSQFLYAAGLTTNEIQKIISGAPITWEEYTALSFKVGQAESLYRESMISTNQPAQPPPSETTNIPSWLPIMFGMVIFLLVIVLLLRRT